MFSSIFKSIIGTYIIIKQLMINCTKNMKNCSIEMNIILYKFIYIFFKTGKNTTEPTRLSSQLCNILYIFPVIMYRNTFNSGNIFCSFYKNELFSCSILQQETLQSHTPGPLDRWYISGECSKTMELPKNMSAAIKT